MSALHKPALIGLARRALPIAVLALGCAEPGTGEARTAQKNPARIECRISRITDGDSFYCGKTGRVRLLLIDAPELSQGAPGRTAQRALAALAPVETLISIETDVRQRDDYDRILGYAYLADGRMLNEEMARSGYVTPLVYPPNVKYVSRIRGAVREAQAAKRGLWATSFFDCSPRDYRARRCGWVKR